MGFTAQRGGREEQILRVCRLPSAAGLAGAAYLGRAVWVPHGRSLHARLFGGALVPAFGELLDHLAAEIGNVVGLA